MTNLEELLSIMPNDLVNRVAEAIYDSQPNWGSLWQKSDNIQTQYREMARAAIKEIRKCEQY